MASTLGGSGCGCFVRTISQTTVSQPRAPVSCRRTTAITSCPLRASARVTDAPTNPVAPVIRTRTASCLGLGQKCRNAVRIRIVKVVVFDTKLPNPALDLFNGVLPRVVRMIPVEIDHVIGFEIESVVPEALDEPVVDKTL